MKKLASALLPLLLLLACTSDRDETPSGDGDVTSTGGAGTGGDVTGSGGNVIGTGGTAPGGGGDVSTGGLGAGGTGTGGDTPGAGGDAPETGGAGSGGDSPGTGGSPSGNSVCPAGSDSLTLDLSGVTLSPLPNLINNYQGFGNFEGPVWISDALYFSNIAGTASPPPAVIWKVVPGGTPEIVVNDSGSNGLATDGTNLYAAMHSDGSISSREMSDLAAATPIVSMFEGQPFDSPNDLVLTSEGAVYFTDPPYQAPDGRQPENRAYYASGGVATALATQGAPSTPNGITLSPDESTLFIGGQNGVWMYSLNEDGSVQAPGTQIVTMNLANNSGIDGLGRDCAGNIYVTVHEDKRVVVLDSSGQQIGALDVPSSGNITNVAFGGASRTTIFVTSLGATPQIHQATLNIPGYPY